MTINFPFPLIKSNSLSDSVWRWCLGLCVTLQPFTRRDSVFLRGSEISPGISLQEKPLRERSLWGWVRHSPMEKHREQNWSWGGGHREGWWLPRSGEIQHCWLPASSLHSQKTAVEQGNKAQFPSLPSPLPAESWSSCQAFSHLHLPLVQVPAVSLSSSPLLRDQPALVPATGIWVINPFSLWFAGPDAPPDPLQKHKVISCSCWGGWQCSHLL